MKNVSEDRNGALIRCIVKDSAGNGIESNSVKLTVNGSQVNPPDTGDSENGMAWFLLLSSLLLCSALWMFLQKDEAKEKNGKSRLSLCVP